MLRYYKIIENGIISAIGTGGGGVEITASEYNEIMNVIHSKPHRTETIDYRLKQDLTWEMYERIETIDDYEINDTDALNILLGRNDDESE